MTDTDLSTWLLTMEAAMRIGCSTRTIERLAADGKLEKRFRPQKGSPDVAVFSPESVAEEAARRQRAPAPFVLGAVPTSHDPSGNGNSREPAAVGMRALRKPDSSYSGEDLIRGLALLLSKALPSPPSPPVAATVAETLYLTLPDAAAFTGLSRTFLTRMIKLGTLTAIKDRGWKIRKKDLEAL